MAVIEISNLIELYAMRNDLAASYELVADIDMWPTHPADYADWTATDYTEEDRVLYEVGGITYIYECLQDTTTQQDPTDTDYWKQVHRAVLPWTAGEYAEGSWVKHEIGSPPVEMTFYANATTTEEPSETPTDWTEMWESAEGWPGIATDTGSTFSLVGHKHILSGMYRNTDGVMGFFNRFNGTVDSVFFKNVYLRTSSNTGENVLARFIDNATVKNCLFENTDTWSAGGGGSGVIGVLDKADTKVFACKLKNVSFRSSWQGGYFGIHYNGELHDCYAESEFSAYPFRKTNENGFIKHVYFVTEPNATETALSVSSCFWNSTTGGLPNADGPLVPKTASELKQLSTYTDIYVESHAGTVDVSGTTVTTNTGDNFSGLTVDDPIYLNIRGDKYVIASIESTTELTLTSAPGDGVDIVYSSGTGSFGLTEAWDIVLKANHDGEEATAKWFIDEGEDYPRLWWELEVPAPVAAITRRRYNRIGSFRGARL